jgi:hypothetical protein
MLIRYWLIGEALKFATGTSKTDLAKAALDVSEQIGNVYTARLAQAQRDPRAFAGVVPEVITDIAGVLGAPGTIAEAAGYTFEGEFARQQQRLAREIAGGLPATQVRIKGAPKFAKRKVSKWNKQVKAAMKVAKDNPKVWPPKLPSARLMEQVTKDLSKLNKGKKPATKKQKTLKAKLKGSIGEAMSRWKAAAKPLRVRKR